MTAPDAPPNKGPTGGSYKNNNNVREIGGLTWSTEPTSVTAELMAYQPTQTAGKRGSSRQASGREVKGGNSIGDAPSG